MTAGYAFDAELAAAAGRFPARDLDDLAAARTPRAAPDLSLPAGVTAADHAIPVPGRADPLLVRVFTPAAGRDEPAPAPVLRPAVVTLHAGGFVLGTIDQDHQRNAALCLELGAVVLAVEYRLAPEHPFPAAPDDCYAALRWAHERADEIGADPDRIALLGRSAGGGLAAATALRARDQGGPHPRFLHLSIPQLDDRLPGGGAHGDRNRGGDRDRTGDRGGDARRPRARSRVGTRDEPAAVAERGPDRGGSGPNGTGSLSAATSMERFVDTPMWTRRAAELSWAYYLGAGVPGSDGVPAYAAPARCDDLAGLPPTYVSAMEFDPLRDDAVRFAGRLLAAGVPTELHLFPGTFHGSAGLVPDAEISRRERAEELAVLRRALT